MRSSVNQVNRFAIHHKSTLLASFNLNNKEKRRTRPSRRTKNAEVENKPFSQNSSQSLSVDEPYIAVQQQTLRQRTRLGRQHSQDLSFHVNVRNVQETEDISRDHVLSLLGNARKVTNRQHVVDQVPRRRDGYQARLRVVVGHPDGQTRRGHPRRANLEDFGVREPQVEAVGVEGRPRVAVEVSPQAGHARAEAGALAALDDAGRLGLVDDLDERWHVADELVVQAFLVEDDDNVHLEAHRGVGQALVAFLLHPTGGVDHGPRVLDLGH